MNKPKGILVGLATLALLGSLGACGASNPQAREGFVPAPAPTETTQPLPEETYEDEVPAESEEVPAEPEETEDPLHKFGETVTYANGLKVTVGSPKTMTNYAYPEEVKKGQKVIRFTVTVDNQTKKRLDPSEFTMTASSGDDEVDFVIDTEHGLEGTPDTKILIGKKRSFDYGYIVNKGEDFVLEVSPDYDSNETIFTS